MLFGVVMCQYKDCCNERESECLYKECGNERGRDSIGEVMCQYKVMREKGIP